MYGLVSLFSFYLVRIMNKYNSFPCLFFRFWTLEAVKRTTQRLFLRSSMLASVMPSSWLIPAVAPQTSLQWPRPRWTCARPSLWSTVMNESKIDSLRKCKIFLDPFDSFQCNQSISRFFSNQSIDRLIGQTTKSTDFFQLNRSSDLLSSKLFRIIH